MTSPNHVARPGRTLTARSIGLLGAAAGFVLLFAPPTATLAQNDPVVAKVNGVEIRQSHVDLAEEDLAEQIAQLPAEARREYLITYLIDMQLVDKAAEDQKLAQSVEFARRLTFAKNKLLMDTQMQSVGKDAVTDAALRKVYDEAAKQIGDEQEVRARHILVETEADAKALLAELKKGTDFAALAKQKSKDPGASEGGDLGYFTKDQMVPEFAEVAFKLNKGQTSDPVKTQFGWHIIKVEDKRKRDVPSFDQVKPQLESYLVRKAQADYVSKLRESAKIERTGGGPTPPPGAPPKR
jgi:peptidyl-prolyl cis-trans isomerase C